MYSERNAATKERECVSNQRHLVVMRFCANNVVKWKAISDNWDFERIKKLPNSLRNLGHKDRIVRSLPHIIPRESNSDDLYIQRLEVIVGKHWTFAFARQKHYFLR